MKFFRKLGSNIFFKLLLGILAISFIFFGVSDFVLNKPNSWVASIDGSTISYQRFLTKLRQHHDLLMTTATDQDSAQKISEYTSSGVFKADVLRLLVEEKVIEKSATDFGVYPGEKPVLKVIAKEPQFRNAKDKFDQNVFFTILQRSGLTEKEYVNMVKNQLAGSVILNAIVDSAPIDNDIELQLAEIEKEKRTADIITISTKNIAQPRAPDDKTLDAFFEQNKKNFARQEFRKISYLSFSKDEISKKQAVTQDDIKNWYDKNLSLFSEPEKRSFYHVVFDKENAASYFLKKVQAQAKKGDVGEVFMKNAIESGKQERSVQLSSIAKESLPEQVQSSAFKIRVGEMTDVLQSPIGFHVFLLTSVDKGKIAPLSSVSNQIASKLIAEKGESALKNMTANVEDSLLISNSIDETAQKFGFSVVSNLPPIDSSGKDENGVDIRQINEFDDLVKNAFGAEYKAASKLFYSKSNDRFYAFIVEQIDPQRERSLSEVKKDVVDMWSIKVREAAAYDLATKVEEEIKLDPSKLSDVALKYRVGINRNVKIERPKTTEMIARNGFANEIFTLDVGKSTKVWGVASGEFLIGVVTSKIHDPLTTEEIQNVKQSAANSFRSDMMEEYNKMLQKKYPIKINEKLLKSDD